MQATVSREILALQAPKVAVLTTALGFDSENSKRGSIAST